MVNSINNYIDVIKQELNTILAEERNLYLHKKLGYRKPEKAKKINKMREGQFMFGKYNRVTIFKALYAAAGISLFMFYLIATSFHPSMIQRKIYMTLADLPLGLVGFEIFINPSIALEAFNAFKSKDRQKNLNMQRWSGVVFLLIAIIRIAKTWL